MSKALVVALGTELTRGIIKDSNCHVVSRELTNLGVHVSSFLAIPDDGTLESVLKDARENEDIIVITGGLGPTEDDLTRKLIAESAGVNLIRNDKAWNHLLDRLGERAYGANERQAFIPDGFTLIENPNGTAPGFYGKLGRAMLFVLPGPPREMEPMLHEAVLPEIARLMDIPEVERDEYTSLITAEARLEELFEEADPELDWATRFQDYRISVYVSGKEKEDRDMAVERLRGMLGDYRFLSGDTTALDEAFNHLRSNNLTLAVAESCTGGLISSEITSKPGASSFYLGSVTSYDTGIKEKVLGVKRETLDKYSVISRECASEMAEGVRDLMGSDYSISVTGVAGPDTQAGKPAGTVCIGFASRHRATEAVELQFTTWGRNSVRRRATVTAFIMLYAYMNGESPERIAATWRNI